MINRETLSYVNQAYLMTGMSCLGEGECEIKRQEGKISNKMECNKSGTRANMTFLRPKPDKPELSLSSIQ